MAQSQVGKIYVGANQMFPGVQTPLGPQIPTSGLIAWYDAADYTSGATWTDKSGNGNNLTLNNTYSKVTSPITSVFLNGGFGSKSGVSGWSSTTDVTYIEIIRPTVATNFVGSWSLTGTNQVTGFQFGGTSFIYTWRGGDTGWYLTPQTYGTTKTTFVSRRFSTGYNNTGDSLVVDYADSNAVSLTKYGSGNFALGRGGGTTYSLGGSVTIIVGAAETNLAYDMPGYYGVVIIYNRKLTDQEVTDVYNYYKTAYSLT